MGFGNSNYVCKLYSLIYPIKNQRSLFILHAFAVYKSSFYNFWGFPGNILGIGFLEL